MRLSAIICCQRGFTLTELLVVVMLAGVMLAGMQGLVGTALDAEQTVSVHNDSLQQARFALRQIVNSVRMTRRLLIPLGENPNTAYSESSRDVLAVTLDPTLDRDKDGWADANNDKDFLDINQNGVRDADEVERIDEDSAHDMNNDAAAGIIGIDDDNDGTIDEGSKNDDDEDGNDNEDPAGAGDEDNDASIDEDLSKNMNADTAPGIINVDDDRDGLVDEGAKDDDDEDGLQGEDWFDPVVFFLSGSTLMQRIPNINPVDGRDYQENPVAENVSLFNVVRIAQGSGRAERVDITLQISPPGGNTVSLNTQVRVGSGL